MEWTQVQQRVGYSDFEGRQGQHWMQMRGMDARLWMSQQQRMNQWCVWEEQEGAQWPNAPGVAVLQMGARQRLLQQLAVQWSEGRRCRVPRSTVWWLETRQLEVQHWEA